MKTIPDNLGEIAVQQFNKIPFEVQSFIKKADWAVGFCEGYKHHLNSNEDACIVIKTDFCQTTIYSADPNELHKLYLFLTKSEAVGYEFYATPETYDKIK